MKDNDFDKIFAHKFDQLGGEPYEEARWLELSRRIDAYERWKRWVLPALLPLFAMLAGGNVFWWYQWHEAKQNEVPSGQRTMIVQSDTIVRSTVVYRYDTIYHNITHVQRYSSETYRRFLPRDTQKNTSSAEDHSALKGISAREDQLASSPAGVMGARASAENQSAPEDISAREDQQASSPTGVMGAGAGASAAGQREKSDGLLNTSPSGKEPVSPDEPAVALQQKPDGSRVLNKQEDTTGVSFPQPVQTPEPVKKAGSPVFYIGRPRLSFDAGWANPSLPGKISGSIVQLGLSADMEIARNFRLGLSAHYDRTSLKSNNTIALGNQVRIPMPGQDYSLKYWETYHLPALSYDLQLAYSLPIHSMWSPWIGVGGEATTFFPYSVEFEFENEVNNIEKHLPVETETYTRWQGMLLMAGVDAHLNQHVALGLEGFLLRRFDKKPVVSDNQIGFKTRLYYIF